jgi:ubiquinone/menaquinone biosynthesis C-methylase UbiE
LKEKLIEYLVCPKCSRKFSLKSLKKISHEVLEGNLICQKNHKFSIKNGIPRFVVDETRDFIKTEDSFSSKWKNFNKTYHSKKWFNKQKKWFVERFGWKTSVNFKNFLKTRSKILDAGTGIGNSAKLFSSNKKAQVFAVDASQSIDFAYKKYSKLANIHFLQADIRKLPFKKNFFDFICSDQVLHHTKDTESSFKMLAKLLSKNGIISIYVYKIKGPMREFTDNYIRKFTVKMTEKQCITFSKDMALLGKSLSKSLQTFTQRSSKMV